MRIINRACGHHDANRHRQGIQTKLCQMVGTHRRIVTDELLEGVSEVEQPPGGGCGEVAAPQLEHAQAREGQERERRRVAAGPRGDDLERGEEAQDPAELLKRAVVAEVGDVGAEVVDGRAGSRSASRREAT